VILECSAVMIICFWNCVPNVIQISHIIAENDIHLFHGLLSVGDRPVRKFRLKLKKNHGIFKKKLSCHNRLKQIYKICIISALSPFDDQMKRLQNDAVGCLAISVHRLCKPGRRPQFTSGRS